MLPSSVLHENIVLHERKTQHKDPGSQEGAGPGITAVLRAAVLKRAGIAEQNGDAGRALYLSQDGRHVAVTEHGRRRLCLLSADNNFQEVAALFDPVFGPLVADASAEDSRQASSDELPQDLITHCCWSPDSKRLLVTCQSSSIFVLGSDGKVLHSWDADSSWAKLQVVCAAWGPAGSSALVLTAARVLCVVPWDGDAAGSDEVIKHSLKRQHRYVQGLAFDERSSTLVVVGDSYSNGSGQPALTVSVWKLEGQQLQLKVAAGKPKGPGLSARLVGGLMGASQQPASPLQVVLSPLAEHAALVVGRQGAAGAGRLALISLLDGSIQDAATSFAGRTAPPTRTGPSLLQDNLATWQSHTASAAFWGPLELAMSKGSGGVAIARLPGFANVLGAAPEKFAPGAVVAVAAAGAAVGRGLLMLEPLVQRQAGNGEGGLDSTAAHGSVGSKLAEWLGAPEAAAASSGSSPTIGWRLVLLAERTPQQMVALYLRDKDWGSAIQLSRLHGLDLDTVYRARWAASPVSKENIVENLTKMADRKWVVAECLSRVAGDYEAARQLLNYGLKETQRHCQPLGGAVPPSPGAPPSPWQLASPGAPPTPQPPTAVAAEGADAAWWRAKRLQLWRDSDRLETLQVLGKRIYDGAAFDAFRGAHLPSAAAALAASGNVAALQVLLSRHPLELGPHLLPLLSMLPESLDPRTYSALLPRSDGTPSGVVASGLGRKPDWVESAATARELAVAAAEGGGAAADAAALLRATEEMIRLAGPGNGPSAAHVAEWYCSRALEIDAATGQLQGALALLEVAGQKGVGSDGLARLLVLGRVLQGVVSSWWPGSVATSSNSGRDNSSGGSRDREGGAHGTATDSRHAGTEQAEAPGAATASGAGGQQEQELPAWAVTLQAFVAMAPEQQLALLVGGSTERSLEGDITNRLAPFLSTLDSPKRQSLLDQLLTQHLDGRLAWCCALVDKEAAQQRAWPGAAALAQSVLAGVRACTLTNQWAKLEHLMDEAEGAISKEEAALQPYLPQQAPRPHQGLRRLSSDGASDPYVTITSAPPPPHHAHSSSVPAAPASAQRQSAPDANGVHHMSKEAAEGRLAALQQQRAAIQTARGHVRAARLLAKHGLAMALGGVAAATQEEGLMLLRQLLARAERHSTSWQDSQWVALWRDLTELSASGLPGTTSQQLLTEYCRTLLHAGNTHLAAAYLFGDAAGVRLGQEAVEQLVVGVAREVLYSASSLEGPEIGHARAALELLHHSEAARAELNTIALLLKLPEFGVHLLPAQFRQLPNRSSLLRSIMESRGTSDTDDITTSPTDVQPSTTGTAAAPAAATPAGTTPASTPKKGGAVAAIAAAVAAIPGTPATPASASPQSKRRRIAPYKRLADVLDIARLLGLDSEEEQLGVRLLAAQMALAHGDAPVAMHLALFLASAGHTPAWELCAQLGMAGVSSLSSGSGSSGGSSSVGDERARLRLLVFAMRHCGPERLGDITDALAEVDGKLRRAAVSSESGARGSSTGGGAEQASSPGADAASPAHKQQHLQASFASAAGETAKAGLPTLGEADAALSALLMAGDAAAAADAVRRAIAVAGSHAQLQRLLALGIASQCIFALAAHAQEALAIAGASSWHAGAGPATPASATGARPGAAAPSRSAAAAAACGAPMEGDARPAQLQRLLALPTGALLAAAKELAPQLAPAERAAFEQALQCHAQLQQAEDGRQLKQWVPGVEPGRFVGGDSDYQREVSIQLASLAGQRAVAAATASTAAAAATATAPAGPSDEGGRLLAQAQQLAAQYGIDPWLLPLWFVHSVVLHAPDMGHEAARQLVLAHEPLLLSRPAEFGEHLHRQLYPLLPAAATPHVSYVLGLQLDSLRALAHQQQQAGSSSADAVSSSNGSNIMSGAAGGTRGAAVAVVQPVLQPLEKLRDLLDKSYKALRGLSVKLLVAAHVEVLVTPCLQAHAAQQAAVGRQGSSDSTDVTSSSAAGVPAGIDAGGRSMQQQQQHQRHPSLSLDTQTLTWEAQSAIYAYVTPINAPHLVKLLKHLGAIGDMLAATDPGRHQLLSKAMRELPGGLPFLVLLCKQLAAPETYQQLSARECLAEEQECERLLDSCVQLLPRLSVPHLAALASFLTLSGPQPLAEEAVGKLRPKRMAPATKLRWLAQAVQLLGSPDATAAATATAAGAAAGGGTAATPAGAGAEGAKHAAQAAPLSPQLLSPPQLPLTAHPKRRALALPLLREWLRLAALQTLQQHVQHVPFLRDQAAASALAARLAAGGAGASAAQQELLGHLAAAGLHATVLLDTALQLVALADAAASAGVRQGPQPPASLAASASVSSAASRASSSSALDDITDAAAGEAAAAGTAAAATLAEGESGSTSSSSTSRFGGTAAEAAVAAVQQALAAQLATALARMTELLSADGTADAAGTQAAVAQVEAVLTLLVDPEHASFPDTAPSPRHAAEQWGSATAQLRSAVWVQLQGFASGVPSSQYSHPAVAALMEVQAGLAAGQGAWGSWSPEGAAGGSSGQQGSLLFARTMKLIGQHWPGMKASPDDIGSTGAATALFDRLLATDATQKPEQLLALQRLLLQVWLDGTALADSQEAQPEEQQQAQQPQAPQQDQSQAEEQQQQAQQQGQQESPASSTVGPEQGLPLSPLHPCWSGLFARMLQGGLAAQVLRHFDELWQARQHSSSDHAGMSGQRQPEPAIGQRQQQQQQRRLCPVSEHEFGALVEAARAHASAAAGLTLGLLSPYAAAQAAAATQLPTAQLPEQDPFAPHLLAALLAMGQFTLVVPPAPAFAQLSRLLLVAAPHPAVWRPRDPSEVLAGARRTSKATQPGAADAVSDAQSSAGAPGGLPNGSASDSSSSSGGSSWGLAAAVVSLEASVLLPHAVCQLAQRGSYSLAAALASQRLRLHPGLMSLEGSLLLLGRYLAASAHAADTPALHHLLEPAAAGSVDGSRAHAGEHLLPWCIARLARQLEVACREAHRALAARLQA